MLTLEKFEEASEIVKRVTNPTKLIYSEYLSDQALSLIHICNLCLSVQRINLQKLEEIREELIGR